MKDNENLRLCQILRNANVRLKPCPFCGCDMNAFPLVMTVKPLHSDEYLIAKLNKGHFLGSENGYAVMCPRCGGQGPSDTIVVFAVNKWNNRHKKQVNTEELYHGYNIDLNLINDTQEPKCCGKCGHI